MHTYNPHDPDYLDARQAEFDEHALRLTDTHNPVPLELAADVRRTDLMDELDRLKNRRAPEPLPDRLAQNQASNNARRRVAPLWDGPSRYEPVAGGARGDSIDQSTPLAPSTADTLVRLLRQAGKPQEARKVIEQVQRGGRPW